ncbi:hypothetical protein [Hymenobacter koreensis]|uniref:DUF2147 domain-containing protein n=1 Tax=Hymenobacter koreensis TaxID=1084523 RepID=A0ABP8IYJ3_9BACT
MFKLLLFPLLLTVAVVAAPSKTKSVHWAGTISNGMKGDKISFDVSPDGKKLTNLTFDGYWRCSGKLERQVVGPEGSFAIENNKVSGVVLDPPGGGGTAWRFDLQGNFSGKAAAKGTFRMNITAMGCDTYKLEWAAAPDGAAK